MLHYVVTNGEVMSSENFRKLDDYQHARLRTEMYLGSRERHVQDIVVFDGTTLCQQTIEFVPALYTALRELLDNSLDEIVGYGKGDTLRVSYEPDSFQFTVEDNGRGLPIDERTDLGKGPAASILLGEARAGRNFDIRGQVAGTNGLGAACTNFTSEWFKLDVWQEGKHLSQTWTEGTYRKKSIHKTTGPSIKTGAKGKSGTRISFKPSNLVFPTLLLPEILIRSTLWHIAVANPFIKVYYNGEKLKLINTKDPVASTLFSEKPMVVHVKTKGFDSRFYLVPNFSQQESEIIHSTLNGISTFQGGSHVEAFITNFTKIVGNVLQPKVTREKLTMRKNDILGGMLIYNVTYMDSPNFDSQTKTRLITEVKQKFKEGLSEKEVEIMVKKNTSWIEEVLNKARDRNNRKDTKKLVESQKQFRKETVPGLRDATSRDRSECILFIGEGESAISNMASVRDPKIHGGIGLRGKILNVHDVKPTKVIENDILKNIMISIGLRIGEPARRESLRYKAIFISLDEDEDGKNILSLMVNFFYKFWPELFADADKPFIYKFSTPFIIVKKGKVIKYFYAHNYHEFKPSAYKGWEITRAKGLGSLTLEDWNHALHEPVLIPIVDDGKLKKILELIFNPKRADDRKQWLLEGVEN